jgi:membrane fusion protein (multidrug efflux system)
MKKNAIIIISTVLLIIVSFFAYDHLMYVTTDNAQVQGRTVMLAPKISGFVVKVNVQEGDSVEKGEVLAELAPQEYDSKLAQAQAELVAIESRMKESEKNYYRLVELYKKSVVSQQQYDQGSSAYHVLKAQYNAAESGIALAQLNLSNTKIIAPSKGFIAKRSLEVGQLANQGVPLLGFVDATDRWVIANFKETEIDQIKIGNLVTIKVDAIAGKKFTGKVASIYSATGSTFTLLPPDNATGNFTKVIQRVPVKIIFDKLTQAEIDELKVGLSTVVKVKK